MRTNPISGKGYIAPVKQVLKCGRYGVAGALERDSGSGTQSNRAVALTI
jgi:hypothetical protein